MDRQRPTQAGQGREEQEQVSCRLCDNVCAMHHNTSGRVQRSVDQRNTKIGPIAKEERRIHITLGFVLFKYVLYVMLFMMKNRGETKSFYVGFQTYFKCFPHKLYNFHIYNKSSMDNLQNVFLCTKPTIATISIDHQT